MFATQDLNFAIAAGQTGEGAAAPYSYGGSTWGSSSSSDVHCHQDELYGGKIHGDQPHCNDSESMVMEPNTEEGIQPSLPVPSWFWHVPSWIHPEPGRLLAETQSFAQQLFNWQIVICNATVTYGTCSPDGQCRWGSRQSRCRSWRRRTSGRWAAGAHCSGSFLQRGEQKNCQDSAIHICVTDVCLSETQMPGGTQFYHVDSHLRPSERCGVRRTTSSPSGRCRRTGRASATNDSRSPSTPSKEKASNTANGISFYH